MEDWNNTKQQFYNTNTCVIMMGGMVDFSPAGFAQLVGGQGMTYDGYLELQYHSLGHTRIGFEHCIYTYLPRFKGKIAQKNSKFLCFEAIFIDGMYNDGICFKDKESHVWMDVAGFEAYDVGDCLAFDADVYRYVKTKQGKSMDYGLRNPTQVQRIEAYELPSDEALALQALQALKCELCLYHDHCDGVFCLLGH